MGYLGTAMVRLARVENDPLRGYTKGLQTLLSYLTGGDMVSTGQAERRLHAEDDRWPPKSPVKLVTANTELALAA